MWLLGVLERLRELPVQVSVLVVMVEEDGRVVAVSVIVAGAAGLKE